MFANGRSVFTLDLGKGGADGSLNGSEFSLKHVRQSLMIFRAVCHPLGTQNR